MDYVWSFLSRNIDSLFRIIDDMYWLVWGLIFFRNGIGSYKVFKISIGVKMNFGYIEMYYEKIDLGYCFLGILFFNDDLENIIISSILFVFKKKLKFVVYLGI